MNKRQVIKNVKELMWALLLAFIFRSFIFEHYRIPSSSMEPTLLIGDHLFISKYAYGYSKYSMMGLPLIKDRIFFKSPKRGDIIVFRSPMPEDDGMIMIKRLIGLPGDRVQLIKNVLYINSEPVPRHLIGFYEAEYYPRPLEKYEEQLPGVRLPNVTIQRPRSLTSPRAVDTGEVYAVPEGHYFFMGDNRDFSRDSRFMRPVPERNLIGRAEVMSWTSKVLSQAARLEKDPRWFMRLRYD